MVKQLQLEQLPTATAPRPHPCAVCKFFTPKKTRHPPYQSQTSCIYSKKQRHTSFKAARITLPARKNCSRAHTSPRLASTHAGKCTKWLPRGACNQVQMTRILASLRGVQQSGQTGGPAGGGCSPKHLRSATNMQFYHPRTKPNQAGHLGSCGWQPPHLWQRPVAKPDLPCRQIQP